MPKRIQRKRPRGWRMTENAVYVGRPTKWGNPFRVGGSFRFTIIRDQKMAAELFRYLMKTDPIDVSGLRGKDLVCWCRLDRPCHADVLLEIANR